MFRRLFHFLTLASFLLLLGVLALWARAGRHPGFDVFLLRTAPSYAGAPRLKCVVVDTYSGLSVTFHTKIVAYTAPPMAGARWRDDVGFRTTAASVQGMGRPVQVRSVREPSLQVGRELSEWEQGDFDARIKPAYRALPLVATDNAPAFRFALRTLPMVFERLGLRVSSPDSYVIDSTELPGSYRSLSVRAPFALWAAALSVLPTCTLPAWLKWLRTRRRLRARLCPACAYDLRSSPGRCPECGRPVVPAETNRAHQSLPRLLLTWPARATRAARWRAGVVTAGLILLALLLVRNTGPMPRPEADTTLRLRRELDEQLATVSRRVDRLRAAGDAAAADALAATLEAVRGRAAGMAPAPTDAPRIHLVSLSETHPRISASAATVRVTATDHPVVLALCGRGGFTWRIRVAPGVRLVKVLLEGQPNQYVEDLPAGVTVDDHTASGLDFPLVPAHADDPDGQLLNCNSLSRHTGLCVFSSLWSGRYVVLPFVVGPENLNWRLQVALAELGPSYRAAALEERDAARARLAGLRFNAPWISPPGPAPDAVRLYGAGDFAPPVFWNVARFDVNGPIGSSIRPLPDADPTGLERSSPTWFRAGGGADDVGVFDPAAGEFLRVRLAATHLRLPITQRPYATALDPRRRTLLIAADGQLYTYSLDTHAVEFTGALTPDAGRSSLTYSAHDDCFYALGPAPAAPGQVMAITRITPFGVPQWMIPVTERVCGPSADGDLYAAGQYLVILTPPLPDPLFPASAWKRRCVVLDPATNTVLYSGPIAPHADHAGP